VVRIDHVYGRGVSFAAANVGGRGGSDHYAVSTWFWIE
jgi:endonuclease/exonuclease/phosphatase (EEP) superfamily protein YafD